MDTMEKRKRNAREKIHDCDSLPLDEKMDCGFGVLAEKIDGNAGKIELVGKKVDRLNDKVDNLENKIDDVEARLAGHFTGVYNYIDSHHEDVMKALGKKKVKGKWK